MDKTLQNQQREQEASNPETEEVARLEEQLSEAVAAEQFFETASGKIWTKLATKEVNRLINDITSEKYRDDLQGYNNALSDLKAYKKMLRLMQVAGSPVRKAKIQERLDNGTEQ
jgi:hypothetical protein